MPTGPDAAPRWDIATNTRLRRADIHLRFGGSNQGSIASAPKANSVFLFSSSVGTQFGYDYDGWHPEGTYHYTGEGQEGDQRLSRGNKAVLDRERALRLFEGVAKGLVRYVGEFRLDPDQPYYFADAPDLLGEMRGVIVFRLWPLDAGHATSPRPVPDEAVVRSIPVSAHQTEKFFANPKGTGKPSERREAALVSRFAAWMSAQDRETSSREILLPRRAGALYCDIFDESTGELIEAKGATSRNNVRLALGQILDYSRYVKAERLAVLFPVRPADDLITLLVSQNVSCVFETEKGRFSRVDADASSTRGV